MAKILAGFLLGVVVTVAVFYLIDKVSVDVSEGPVWQPAPSDDLAGMEPSQSRNRTEVATTTNLGGENPGLQSPPESAVLSEPSASQLESEDARQLGNDVSRSPSVAQERPANHGYPPEIADMIENDVDKDLQSRYENDEREESWATYMEGQLQAYFSQKPELSQFNFSLIDCRTSFCEIHALAYGHDALTLWTIGTADFVTQTWHDFGGMSMNQHNPQPDILGIVLILTRKPTE